MEKLLGRLRLFDEAGPACFQVSNQTLCQWLQQVACRIHVFIFRLLFRQHLYQLFGHQDSLPVSFIGRLSGRNCLPHLGDLCLQLGDSGKFLLTLSFGTGHSFYLSLSLLLASMDCFALLAFLRGTGLCFLAGYLSLLSSLRFETLLLPDARLPLPFLCLGPLPGFLGRNSRDLLLHGNPFLFGGGPLGFQGGLRRTGAQNQRSEQYQPCPKLLATDAP
jgi:hypothetical protein